MAVPLHKRKDDDIHFSIFQSMMKSKKRVSLERRVFSHLKVLASLTLSEQQMKLEVKLPPRRKRVIIMGKPRLPLGGIG